MDRLKYRVWDKRLNRYLGKDDPTQMLLENGNLAYLDDEGMKFYEVEFCTGLKDKNGKLIYEGDELKDWKNNNFVIAFDEEYAQFVAKDESGWQSPIEHDVLEDCEIIGNIHTENINDM